MEYKGEYFEAIIATPGCGKSYLCDNNKNYIDVDEERLKCKYVVPSGITRAELEKTKGDRPFEKRSYVDSYVKTLYNKLDNYRKEGKVLIAAPHTESFEYFIANNIPFCFVYPCKDIKNEIKQRMIARGNNEKLIKENDDAFYDFYNSNSKETRAVISYEFGKDEYLSDIIKKFGK